MSLLFCTISTNNQEPCNLPVLKSHHNLNLKLNLRKEIELMNQANQSQVYQGGQHLEKENSNLKLVRSARFVRTN